MSDSQKPRRSRPLASQPGSSPRATGSRVGAGAKDPKGTGRSPADRRPDVSVRSTAEAGLKAACEDVVVVHSRTEDGQGMNVVRKRGDELSVGVVRPLEEGKPILGDVVTLKPRAEHPALFDVETEVALPKAEAKRTAGPSRVSTPSYRKGWDSLWGGRRRRQKPN